MSPEQMNGMLSFKIDIWAFGCVLLQFATGLKPFDDIPNEVAMCLKIFQGVSPLQHCLKQNKLDIDLIEENDDFKKVLEQCFVLDYKKRPTAERLAEDKFFEGYITQYF
mmetsp:Transcript_3929/g.6666  ORF Transcript_3929/g.6666 Transcript_3929/m.6666 type:complete len:109 (-) Transcript_3929:14-340(-)